MFLWFSKDFSIFLWFSKDLPGQIDPNLTMGPRRWAPGTPERPIGCRNLEGP